MTWWLTRLGGDIVDRPRSGGFRYSPREYLLTRLHSAESKIVGRKPPAYVTQTILTNASTPHDLGTHGYDFLGLFEFQLLS